MLVGKMANRDGRELQIEHILRSFKKSGPLYLWINLYSIKTNR